MCFLASQSDRWSVKSGFSFPQSCFHRLFFCVSPSVPPPKPTLLYYSPSHWPCYHPFHTTFSISVSPPACPCHSACLSSTPRLLTSFSFPLCFSSSLSQRQFYVIKSKVAPLVHQLCHPDGQIKNWFLRLIPYCGWMLLVSSLPSLAFNLLFLPSLILSSCHGSIFSSTASSYSQIFFCSIKCTGAIDHADSQLPTASQHSLRFCFLARHLHNLFLSFPTIDFISQVKLFLVQK